MGWWGKIEIEDQLSPAEAEVGAELSKKNLINFNLNGMPITNRLLGDKTDTLITTNISLNRVSIHGVPKTVISRNRMYVHIVSRMF